MPAGYGRFRVLFSRRQRATYLPWWPTVGSWTRRRCWPVVPFMCRDASSPTAHGRNGIRFASAGADSAALQVGDHSPARLDELVRFDTEYVMPCTCRSPHFVVLQQIGIDEDSQLGCMAKRRDATCGFGNPRIGSGSPTVRSHVLANEGCHFASTPMVEARGTDNPTRPVGGWRG